MIKRDIDYINHLITDNKTTFWNDLSREKQAEYLMNWIENIELKLLENKIKIKKINFRNSFFEDLCNLYSKGYLDLKRNAKDDKNNKN